MRVLVTGGAGFIGSHLVEKLIEQNHNVVVLDDLSAGLATNIQSVMHCARLIVGSVCDLGLVRRLAMKVDVIFHLATQCLVKGLEDPKLMHKVNDIGTYNICLAAEEFGNKIVYIGTSEEYGIQKEFPIREDAQMNPVSIYGLTKLIAEEYVKFFHKIHGVPAVVIRPFNTYGPRHREDVYAGVITAFMKRIESNKPPIIFGDGLQTRDFTYVSDIVDGILLLSKLGNGEVVNIGSGRDISLLEIADAVAQVWTGRDDLKDKPIFTHPRPNDVRRLRADISLAKSYGYKPKVSFREGLKKYVKWYKSIRHG